METPLEPNETSFDVIESIRKHIAQLKPLATKRGLVCVGDYPAKIFLEGSIVEEANGFVPILIQKSSQKNLRLAQSIAVPHTVLGLGTEVDTHFWFNVKSYLAENKEYSMRLSNSIGALHEAIVFASLWDGLGSALLPYLISQFKASNMNSVGLAVMPSKAQSADAHLNALACIGNCASNDYATIVLLSRDSVEDFVGVDRNGSAMKGNRIVSYILEIMLAKDTLMQELNELSRAFSIKMYTAMLLTGGSFKIYGSFERMLDAASLNPFLSVNLPTTSLLYLLVRVPSHLKETLSRGKIELATAKWSKVITNLKSIYVSEPIYVDDPSDRVDVVVFAGNFDLTDLKAFLQKKTGKITDEMIKKGLIEEKEWETIIKSLAARH